MSNRTLNAAPRGKRPQALAHSCPRTAESDQSRLSRHPRPSNLTPVTCALVLAQPGTLPIRQGSASRATPLRRGSRGTDLRPRIAFLSDRRERRTSLMPVQLGTPVRAEIAVSHTKQTTATHPARYSSQPRSRDVPIRLWPVAICPWLHHRPRVAQFGRASSEPTLAFVVAPGPVLAIMGRTYFRHAPLVRRPAGCLLR
jgi:hypothetical protein